MLISELQCLAFLNGQKLTINKTKWGDQLATNKYIHRKLITYPISHLRLFRKYFEITLSSYLPINIDFHKIRTRS